MKLSKTVWRLIKIHIVEETLNKSKIKNSFWKKFQASVFAEKLCAEAYIFRKIVFLFH